MRIVKAEAPSFDVFTQHHRMARVGRNIKDHESPTPPAKGRVTNLPI